MSILQSLARTGLMTCIVALVPWIGSAAAQPTTLQRGLDYLRATQSADGSWGGTPTSLDMPLRTTATVARAFQLVQPTDPVLAAASSYLSNQAPAVVEDLALVTETLSIAGVAVAASVDAIKSGQRSDGGWGLALDGAFGSEVVDTVAALRALRAANALDAGTVSAAAVFLLGIRNPDGGWGPAGGHPSRVFHTALVLLVLKDLEALFDFTAPLAAGAQFVEAQQKSDGSFGETFETAVATEALLRLAPSPTAREAALSHLVATQHANGSWADDAFTTALAVRLFKVAETPPTPRIQAIDLALLSNGVRTPATTFNAFQLIIITVTADSADVALQAVVREPSGAVLPTSRVGNEFAFNTSALTPGAYAVVVRAVATATGAVVDEQTAAFTIAPTVAVLGTVLVANPPFTHVGATATVDLALSLASRANVAADLVVEFSLRTPTGAVLTSGTRGLSIAPNSLVSGFSLTSFTHSFSASGTYPAEVRILHGSTVLATATATIVAAPAVRVDATQSVTPGSVAPDRDRRVRINIRLRGVEQQP
jgi:hypothetical protein